ncbi:MAG TPA: hypothetical protein VM032_19785, partial [Vicinamibacterales bacterium]|nr:hypothetical protein [Vicinamibacterales bacterium]
MKPQLSVLVIDIGGSRVKLFASAAREAASFRSGPAFGPQELIAQVRRFASAWEYEAVSIGFPGGIGPDGPKDAGNLGDGWVGFDFAAAFDRPVRLINDAAMQALGAYAGGRMLFLGLGTGLGSAIVAQRVIVSLELGSLVHQSGETFADRLGAAGLARLGNEAWQQTVHQACAQLQRACSADYVLIGGGNAERVEVL